MHVADRRWAWSPLNRPPAVSDALAGVIALPSRDRVCIYGAGLGRREAPLDDPTWEVWALNTVLPMDASGRIRADLWWDIHQRVAQSEQDLAWFRALPVTLMTAEDMLDLGPHCVRYPLERVKAHVADGPFACTFALQIAYALSVGIRDIGLYGVELAYGTERERSVEWASVSWWMGFAEARGVTFHLPSLSRLGRHPNTYGLDYEQEIDEVTMYLQVMEEAAADGRLSVGG